MIYLGTQAFKGRIETTTATAIDVGDNTIFMNNASANVILVNTNAFQELPIWTVVVINNIGAGTTSVTADPGVTINGTDSGTFTLDQHAGAAIQKIGTDTWVAPNQTVA